MKPDNTFFTLRCWRESMAEKDFIRKVYATNLLTPRERRTLAAYHSGTYLRLHAHQQHLQRLQRLLADNPGIEQLSEEERLPLLIEFEEDCSSTLRTAWNTFDCLGHEINLIAWRLANRRELYHPYVQEKKISFYMVRERLLNSEKLQNSAICQLLTRQTRDTAHRANQYILLSQMAMRSQHRPLLLGCRWQTGENNQPLILLSENDGMPGDHSVNLQDLDLMAGIQDISQWLEQFIDQIYQALNDDLKT